MVDRANPTAEQRARFDYVEAKTVNPEGVVATVTAGKREVHEHKVCRRQPVYVTLHKRGVLNDDEKLCLDWYDLRYALAHKGLTLDSLARASRIGGGKGDGTPTDAAVQARRDVTWARARIEDGLVVFDKVMKDEMSLAEIAGHGGAGKTRARVAFKAAVGWLTRGIIHRVRLEPRA